MSHKHLKEELTCPICMELFRRPRRLPCGHSYCHICLKAMLERCSEDSRLYLHYPGSLVCPECREEVNLDYGSGVEAIPLDFKLSKLVDLFKFMKKNDSSDSSSDELQACSTAPSCALTSYPPENSAAAVTIAFLSSTNHSAVSSPVSQSLVASSAVSSSTSVDSSHTSVGSSHPQIATTISIASLPTHLQTATTSVTSSTQPDTSTPPTQANISATPLPGICQTILASPTYPQTQARREQLSSHSSAVVFVDSASTSHPFFGGHDNNLQPALNISSRDVPYQCNPDTICLTISEGRSSNLLPSNIANNSSATEATNYQTQAFSKNSLSLDVPSDVTVSLETNTDGGSRTDRSSHDLNSGLGAVGGLDYNGRGRNSHPGMTEQNGDSSEIISNWVNENHFYSENSRDVSQCPSSLPVKDEEAQLCYENILVSSRDDDRTRRAQSVPAEMRELKRSGEAGSVECVAAKGPAKVRTRRVRSGVFSRFVESDSSSDSSESDTTRQRPARKPKRWLMTRFLRSVILSESSSTDYSDNDSTLENKAATSQRDTDKTDSQVPHASSSRLQSLTTDQIHSPQTSQSQDVSVQKRSRTTNQEIELHLDTCPNSPGHDATLKTKTPDMLSTQPLRRHSSSSSPRQQTGSDMSPTLHSADSTTSPKELTNQSSLNQPTDSTIPKDIHNSSTEIINVVRPISTTMNTSIPQTCNPHLTGRHSGQTSRTEIYQQTSHLHSVGSPPTFYDNVNVITNNSDRKAKHDNLPSVGSPPTFYDNVNVDHNLQQTRYNNGVFRRLNDIQESVSLSLRDPNVNPGSRPGFEPHSGQQNATHTSGPYEGQTLYDNINSSPTRPIQTSHHNSMRTANPITDIEELKTGYEHVQPEYEVSDNGEHDSSFEVGHEKDRHVGILNDNIRWLPISAHDSQYGNEQRNLASSLVTSSNPVSARLKPENIALVDSSGHRSSYDNVSNSVYPDQLQQCAPALSSQGNTGDRRDISEGISLEKTECSSQRQGIQNLEYRTAGHHNAQHLVDTLPYRNEDLQYVDNYFDQYSQHFRRGCTTDQNSATPRGASTEGDATRRTGVAATILSTDSISSRVTKDVQNPTNPGAFAKTDTAKSQRKRDSPEVVTEALTTPETGSGSLSTQDSPTTSNSDEGPLNSCNSEGGSISGAYMPQNKKPQSRLKKFFTSLLSLSSSDNEEDKNYNRNSSSDSSDW